MVINYTGIDFLKRKVKKSNRKKKPAPVVDWERVYVEVPRVFRLVRPLLKPGDSENQIRRLIEKVLRQR